MRDFCLALRQLLKAPASLTIVLTLALGIGATTAIFSLARCRFVIPSASSLSAIAWVMDRS